MDLVLFNQSSLVFVNSSTTSFKAAGPYFFFKMPIGALPGRKPGANRVSDLGQSGVDLFLNGGGGNNDLEFMF